MGFRHIIHPFLVGTGKHIGGCPGIDLFCERGAGGIGEHNFMPLRFPQMADIVQRIRQAGGGEHGEAGGFGNGVERGEEKGEG
jgi:hypothetical protein